VKWVPSEILSSHTVLSFGVHKFTCVCEAFSYCYAVPSLSRKACVTFLSNWLITDYYSEETERYLHITSYGASRIYGNWFQFPSGSHSTMKYVEALLGKKPSFSPTEPKKSQFQWEWWSSHKVLVKSMWRISGTIASVDFMTPISYLNVKHPEKTTRPPATKKKKNHTKLQSKHLHSRITVVSLIW